MLFWCVSGCALVCPANKWKNGAWGCSFPETPDEMNPILITLAGFMPLRWSYALATRHQLPKKPTPMPRVSPLNCNQALQQVQLAFSLLTWLFMPPGKSACAHQGDPDQRTFLQHVLMCDSFHKPFQKKWRTLCLCPACVWQIQPLELPPRQRLRGDDCSCLIKV